MEEFRFDLNAIERGAPVETSERWGNQVNFPIEVVRGSFLPQRYKFFFIDPGVKAKYSYLARIPLTASFAILHCSFKYADGRSYSHTAERTIAIAATEAASHRSPELPAGGADGG